MAQRGSPFTIRLSVKDADTVRRALRGIGTDGETALRKLERSAQSANRSAGNLQRGLGGADRALGGLASRAGLAGSALSALGPAGTAAAAGLALVTLGLGKAIAAGQELEKSQFTIAQLLKTTGAASGQTAREIEQLSQSIGLATLQSIQGAREAAAALLTFKNVSGDAFERTLRVAADLSAVLGQDLKSATLQLGKALEDPERNLSQLNRSGISFSQTQINLVKQFKETGQEAAALNEILKAIEGQVGGAGAAQARGLSGAFDNLREATDLWFSNVAQRSGLLDALADKLNKIAEGVIKANRAFSIEGQLERAREELARLEAERAKQPARRPAIGDPAFRHLQGPRARAGSLGDPGLEQRIKRQREAIEDLTAELEDLEEQQAREAAGARAAGEAHQAATTATTQREKAVKKALDAIKDVASAQEKEIELIAKTLDATAELVAKRDDAAAKQLDALKDELAAAQKNFELLGKSNVEREIEVRLLREVAAARRNGVDLTDEEIAARRKLIEQIVKYDKANEAAKKAAEAYAKPFENAAENIQRAFGDLFTGIFENGVDSFGDLADTIKRIFARLAGEIAALMVIRPVLGSIGGVLGLPALGAAVGAPIGTAPGSILPALGRVAAGPVSLPGGGTHFGSAASLATVPFASGSLLQGTLGGFGAINRFGAGLGFGLPGLPGGLTSATLSSVLAGGSIGSLAAGLFGLGSGNFLVDTATGLAGSVGGAALGAQLGAIGGPIGAAVGGFIGTALGGLFGKKQGVGPQAAVTIGGSGLSPSVQSRLGQYPANVPVVPYTGNFGLVQIQQHKGGPATQAQQAGKAVVAGLNTILDTLGATLAAPSGIHAARFASLNARNVLDKGGRQGPDRFATLNINPRSGIVVGGVLGEKGVKANFGKDLETAVKAAIIKSIEQAASFDALSGVGVYGRRAALSSGRANFKSGNLEQFAADLDLGVFIDGIGQSKKESSEAAKAVEALNDAFDEMERRVRELQLGDGAIARLSSERNRQLGELRSDFEKGVTDAIAAIKTPMSLAFQQIEDEHKIRLQNAKDLGADTLAVWRLRWNQIQQLQKQIRAFDKSIEISLLSITDPNKARFEALRENFIAMRDEAIRLGGSVEKVTELYRAQYRQLVLQTRDFNRQTQLDILRLTGQGDRAALLELQFQQEARLEAAKAVGADLVQIEKLFGLERADLLKRIAEGTVDALETVFDRIKGSIADLLYELQFGTLGAASPAQRLSGARSAFDSARAGILGGAAADENLTAIVREFIDASKAYNATGGTFGADLDLATTLLEFVQQRGFAAGGIATGPAIFGESGPEAAIPLDSGLRIPIAEVRLEGGVIERGFRETVRALLRVENRVGELGETVSRAARDLSELRRRVAQTPAAGRVL